MPSKTGAKKQRKNTAPRKAKVANAKASKGKRKRKVKLDRNGKPVPPQLIEHAWKPGNSGNPNGRPPLPKTLSHHMRDMLGEPARKFEVVCRVADKAGLPLRNAKGDDLTVGQVLAMASVLKGFVSNDSKDFLKIIFDRTEGSVAQAQGGVAPEEAAQHVREYLADITASIPEPA